MSFLTSFINPSILLCLGIIALVGGLLYIHVESKTREQNHKISSMLSLVSSLADEVNTIKHVLQNNRPITNPLRVIGGNNRLIDVSDGSDSEDEDESETDSDDETELYSDDETEDESANNDTDVVDIEVYNCDEKHCILDTIESTIKVLKLDIGTVLNNTEDEYSSSSSEDLDDLASEVSFDELPQETETISTYDLKTIQLTNLEDIATVVVDYKKMSVSMLRTVINDKNLAADPSKLKKPELLKLLGC